MMNQDNHEAIFAAAWNQEDYTSIELDPLDVNQVLANEYDGANGLTLNRTKLWEMEVKKAARPNRFIPSVIRAGTARGLGRRILENGEEVFHLGRMLSCPSALQEGFRARAFFRRGEIPCELVWRQ